MSKKCPKCGYVRKEIEIAPDWQCPQCSIVYAKVGMTNENDKVTKTVKNNKPNILKKEKLTSMNTVKLLAVSFACLLIGYFAGREHIKYEIKSTFNSAADDFRKNLSSAFTPRKKKPKAIKSESNLSLLIPEVFGKEYKKYKYDDNIWFDIKWNTSNLKKKTRAVKGTLIFADLFGEARFKIQKTINKPLTPDEPNIESGVGFNYNQFKSSHVWMRSTELKNMTFSYEINSIIYADGTKETF